MAAKPITKPAARSAEKRLYSVPEFCYLHGIGKTTAYDLMKAGKLKYVVVGSERRIPHSESERIVTAGV